MRRNYIEKDMLELFRDADVECVFRIKFFGEEGVDAKGIFRDALTEFWQTVSARYFVGDGQFIPTVHPHLTPRDFKTMGKILYIGFNSVGYFPIQFSKACLISAIYGDNEVCDDLLMEGFVATLSRNEGDVLRKALDMHAFDEDTLETLLVLFGRLGVTCQITPETLSAITLQCAKVELIQKPSFALASMDLEILFEIQEFRTISGIIDLYNSLQPTGKSVAKSLKAEPENSLQQKVLEYLIRAVRSFEGELLMKFLRFCTGSDAMAVPNIEVYFNSFVGLQRRFVAHTCTSTLEVPVSYTSYKEFKNELVRQLNSDFWEIGFV